MTSPVPDRLTYLIGDIHGADDLLDALLLQIRTQRGDQSADLVVLGDMIDRGPDSAAVLRRLHTMGGTVCLRGNHEQMALDFLDAPRASGPRWLSNGGDATLASFGITNVHATKLDTLADMFRSALGALEPWLRRLPLTWQSGNLVAAHAGLDPRRGLARQTPDAILWGRGKFRDMARRDGLWVAHGHWPAPLASCADGRLSLDTGAGQGGVLSAARITSKGTVEFLSAGGDAGD